MPKATSLKERLTKIADEKEESEKKPQPIPDEDLVNFNTRLPDSLIIDMKVYCARNKIKIQDFVAEMLREGLEARK